MKAGFKALFVITEVNLWATETKLTMSLIKMKTTILPEMTIDLLKIQDMALFVATTTSKKKIFWPCFCLQGSILQTAVGL